MDAADNPVDYDAHYYMLEGKLKAEPVGALGVGYQVLGGGDDGKARTVTPFATGHKLNGFADVFLNNGSNRGLRKLGYYDEGGRRSPQNTVRNILDVNSKD